MTERAEGYWWVRLDGEWEIVNRHRGQGHGGLALNKAPDHPWDDHLWYRLDQVEEWGPYLGTKPESP